jgi:hypothetical protein
MHKNPCDFCASETSSFTWNGKERTVHRCRKCYDRFGGFSRWLDELFCEGETFGAWEYVGVVSDFFLQVVLPRAIELGHLDIALTAAGVLTVRTTLERVTEYREEK